jgi:hypothetical protein
MQIQPSLEEKKAHERLVSANDISIFCPAGYHYSTFHSDHNNPVVRDFIWRSTAAIITTHIQECKLIAKVIIPPVSILSLEQRICQNNKKSNLHP